MSSILEDMTRVEQEAAIRLAALIDQSSYENDTEGWDKAYSSQMFWDALESAIDNSTIGTLQLLGKVDENYAEVDRHLAYSRCVTHVSDFISLATISLQWFRKHNSFNDANVFLKKALACFYQVSSIKKEILKVWDLK